MLAFALALAACGGKDEAPPAPASAPTEQPAAPAVDAPAVTDAEVEEAMVIQPTLVDTLTIDELLTAAETAVQDRQLFVPVGESAFEMYLRVVEQEPLHVRAKNALSDLFPYAMLYVEQRTAAGDLAEGERVLDLMERADANAPALPRLQRAVADLRNRVAAEAQRATAAAEAQQQRASEEAQRAAASAEEAQRVAEAAEAEARRQAEAAAQAAAQAAQTPTPAPAPAPVAIPAPPPPPPPAPVETAPVAPTVISAVQPRYPPIALRRRIEGSVEVGFTIMPDGSVSNVRVLTSHPGNTFDRESINAMERWRFSPPGREVESRRVFDYKLE